MTEMHASPSRRADTAATARWPPASWGATLLLAFGVLFPAGLATIGREPFAAILPATYRWCVRFTPIGWLLNGPRQQANPGD